MFPDFPEFKSRAQKLLLRRVESAIPEISPVLRDVRTFRQHEGDSSKLSRSDGSTDVIDFPETASEVIWTREEMKSFNFEQMEEKLLQIARDFAAAQTKLLIKKLSEATASVGNIVSAGGEEFKPEHFFEMLRKIMIDFDPETGAPRLPSFLVHPRQMEKLREKLDQWLVEPSFAAEHQRILQEKAEEWRAREDLRKLVD